MKPDRIAHASSPPPRVASAYPDFDLEALFATSNQVVSDAVIEQFVRDPASLPTGIRTVVEELLAENCGAKLMEEFYRSFYEELDRLPGRTPSKVESFIISIFPSENVVPLFPVETRAEMPEGSNGKPIPVITSSGYKLLLQPVILLGSREARVVVYLLRDMYGPQYCRLYVLMSDASKRANLVITFPDLDVDVFVENGTADFVLSDDEPSEKLFASAILRFSVYEVERHKGQFTSSKEETARGNTISLPTGQSLQIEDDANSFRLVHDAGYADDPTLIRRVVLRTDDGSAHVMKIADGHGELMIDHPVERAWIGLYE